MNGLMKNIKNHVLKSGAEWCTADYGTREPGYSNHHGIDFINANGGACEVIAIADGEVVYVQDGVRGYNEVYSAGNFVKLRHENAYFSRYLHLAPDSIRVKVGDKVKAGQVLGMEGGTGYCIPAEAVHLHFDVNDGRAYVDPLPYLIGEKTFDRVIPATSVKVGDKVRVKEGELFSNGVQPYPEVYEQTYEVLQLSLNYNEVLIGIGGTYTGWMYISSLELTEKTSSAEDTQPDDEAPETDEEESNKIKPGDIVSVSRKAEFWDNGVAIPMWVYDNEYYVSENVNGRAVIGEYKNDIFYVTGAIQDKYLIPVNLKGGKF